MMLMMKAMLMMTTKTMMANEDYDHNRDDGDEGEGDKVAPRRAGT